MGGKRRSRIEHSHPASRYKRRVFAMILSSFVPNFRSLWPSAHRSLRLAGWLALALGACAAPLRAEETLRLSSLDLSAVEQGWGMPHADRSVDGNPITLAGRKFDHGLGTHSPGTFLIDLE